MSISEFGRFGDQGVQEIKLRGSCGTEASVITYGAILRDRSSFASIALAADDALEIVHFVGGG